MKATIGNSLIAQLKPRNKQYEVRDNKLIGFLIRVNPSGKMNYICEYKRGTRITLGKVGVLTPAQARDMALAVLGDMAKGIDPKDAKPIIADLTLRNFIEKEYAPWVQEHRKVGKNTLAHIRRCFFELFGDKPLIEITPAPLDQWRTRRLKEGASTETVNRDIATLKAAISKAVLWGFIEKHPLEKLKLLKVDRSGKIRYLTQDEENRLRMAIQQRDESIKAKRASGNEWRKDRGYECLTDLKQAAFADHMTPMILLSINTGLRRGELFSLCWENVDFERAMLTIEGAYAKSGKTRHIPLNIEALQTLQDWRSQTAINDLVFPGKNGARFDTIKKAWAGILKAATIKNFRWHDLRHHFASKLVMASVDLNTVRELLGHSDMSMTLRYAHLAPEHKAEAVARLMKNSAALQSHAAIN